MTTRKLKVGNNTVVIEGVPDFVSDEELLDNLNKSIKRKRLQLEENNKGKAS